MSSFRCRVSADICNKKWAAFIRSGVGGPRLRGIKTMALTVLPNLKAPRGGAAMSGARVDGGMRAVREASNRYWRAGGDGVIGREVRGKRVQGWGYRAGSEV